MPVEQVEAIAIEAFPLPWTARHHIDAPRLEAFRQVLQTHYSPELLRAFETSREKFVRPARSSTT
jgi:hypothetical protein